MIQELNALSGQRLPDVGDRLKLAVAEDCARFSLRVRPDALARAGKAFGCAMPARIWRKARMRKRNSRASLMAL